MPSYRRPLANLVFEFCRRIVAGEQPGDTEYCDIVWKILADEAVLRILEEQEEEEKDIEGDEENTEEESVEDASVNTIVAFLTECASAPEPGADDDEDEIELTGGGTFEAHGPSSPQTTHSVGLGGSSFVSPTLSRVQSDGHPDIGPSRSQSLHPSEDFPDHPSSSPLPSHEARPYPIQALSALISIFSQLCFTPHALLSNQDYVLAYTIRIFEGFTFSLTNAKSTRVRVTTLQFLMRLRADRDHKLYFCVEGYDLEGQIAALAGLIGRTGSPTSANDVAAETPPPPPTLDAVSELRKARARARMPPSDRDIVTGRGRGGAPSQSFPRNATSRSRSRAGRSGMNTTPIGPGTRIRQRPALWKIPEHLPFTVSAPDTLSEMLGTYDPTTPDGDNGGNGVVLPVSEYLHAILTIFESEKNWDVLSYVLCHLPAQLANKHLFCGPKSRVVISKILTALCVGIQEGGGFGRSIDRWPTGIKLRDAHGLVYHTLSVLVSYKANFDTKQRHSLVEVFFGGLSGQPPTIRCCLSALSISAYELQPSITRCLSGILEKLSQIMSNPEMTVHILSLLSIIGSHPPLYSNFIENDYKMVFAVALQYLQHHNRMTKAAADSSPSLPDSDSSMSSWALSQHVRILSYHLVYTWFLAVKLPDRPKYLRYITRQLLLANEGNEQVDDPTEVCFDWLARYTYASADPRPANSLFQDVVFNPTQSADSEGSKGNSANANANASDPNAVATEKTWLLGNSVVTIRVLRKRGWIEILSRRPSGYTKFLGRLENVPLVGPGEVDPDLGAVPAIHLMDREDPRVGRPDVAQEGELTTAQENREEQKRLVQDLIEPEREPGDDGEGEGEGEPPARPDPLAGYVWSGSAPSQRRKDVSIDPSFFALQMSAYPFRLGPSNVQMLVNSSDVPRFASSLDRIPVIDTHKVGIMYVAPNQKTETEILRNTYGSPAYTRFLEGLGRLISLRGQIDVYAGGLDPDEDGEYAYAWWDDIGQILYHTATMMPSHPQDEQSTFKKRHIGNDFVRIVWNDSGMPYRFDTLSTQFQFVNIVIEPHSVGRISAYSNNLHENEYFKVTVQRAEGMIDFSPVEEYKLVSAENLAMLVRRLSLLADWFAFVFSRTDEDTRRVEVRTNWQERLGAIRRFKDQQVKASKAKAKAEAGEGAANGKAGTGSREREQEGEGDSERGQKEGILAQEAFRDFTSSF